MGNLRYGPMQVIAVSHRRLCPATRLLAVLPQLFAISHEGCACGSVRRRRRNEGGGVRLAVDCYR